MIRKLLIANRGEIACRIIRTCRELGIATVAVHSDADASARHVEMADEAVRLGPAPVADSYLRADAIVAAARATGADAVHPGYGFLSENPDFVEAVEAAGLIFIGPAAASIRAMGLKDKAKALMEEAGVPVVPGYHGAAQDPERLARASAEIGYPVLIKARAGGGGKGMRRVDRAEDFAEALAAAQREGQGSFGDPAVLIEKYIDSPRHIEVQVFGDRHGHVVHLFERDCSLQRRHQKVIEEAPAPGMTEEMRAAMGAAAVAAAKAVDYVGAGTVEFIVDGSGPLRPDGFWFMEMNTRLQVEHPVTEAITGLDLVGLQIAVAEGAPLPFAQEDLAITGHAVEARLYAEDAPAGFLPATGPLSQLHLSEALRVDTGVREGDEVTPHYDPMIAKLIASGPDRASAFRALARALEESAVAGCVTNRAFLARLVQDEDVLAGRVDTGLIARRGAALAEDRPAAALDHALAALAWSGGQAGFRLFGPARSALTLAGSPPGTPPVTLRMEALRAAPKRTDREAGQGLWRVQSPLGAVELSGVRVTADRVEAVLEGRAVSARYHRTPDTLVLHHAGATHSFTRHDPAAEAQGGGADQVRAPMPGRIVAVLARPGAELRKGDGLLVLEAMKMEHRLSAPRDGVLAVLLAEEGDQVSQGAVLAEFETG